jgi:hypothetical protein
MIGEKIQDLFFKDIPEKLEGITSAYREYYKAVTYEKLVILISGLLIVTILFVFVNLFVVFGAIAAALFIGQLIHNFALGFLIMGVFYLLLGWLVYAFRKPWIIHPIIRVVQSFMYADDSVFDKMVKSDDEEA